MTPLQASHPAGATGRHRRRSRRADERDSAAHPLFAVPWLAMPVEELRSLPLDARTAYVISLVDGQCTVETILDLCEVEVAREQALDALAHLLELGAIELRDQWARSRSSSAPVEGAGWCGRRRSGRRQREPGLTPVEGPSMVPIPRKDLELRFAHGPGAGHGRPSLRRRDCRDVPTIHAVFRTPSGKMTMAAQGGLAVSLAIRADRSCRASC